MKGFLTEFFLLQNSLENIMPELLDVRGSKEYMKHVGFMLVH